MDSMEKHFLVGEGRKKIRGKAESANPVFCRRYTNMTLVSKLHKLNKSKMATTGQSQKIRFGGTLNMRKQKKLGRPNE